jgi:hypothetical protein
LPPDAVIDLVWRSRRGCSAIDELDQKLAALLEHLDVPVPEGLKA